ncbi:hypothetical protein DV515_00014608 [Chloebia gouldiae]|uniref:Uncharacterized protein n=1 Tax=Chloebia gouldiae TaxID=44316 RepID=A0A3L8RYU6_CHLGU|nr:hypothetical protein DV515_00014608 [Chloebia gouldiae]
MGGVRKAKIFQAGQAPRAGEPQEHPLVPPWLAKPLGAPALSHHPHGQAGNLLGWRWGWSRDISVTSPLDTSRLSPWLKFGMEFPFLDSSVAFPREWGLRQTGNMCWDGDGDGDGDGGEDGAGTSRSPHPWTLQMVSMAEVWDGIPIPGLFCFIPKGMEVEASGEHVRGWRWRWRLCRGLKFGMEFPFLDSPKGRVEGAFVRLCRAHQCLIHPPPGY